VRIFKTYGSDAIAANVGELPPASRIKASSQKQLRAFLLFPNEYFREEEQWRTSMSSRVRRDGQRAAISTIMWLRITRIMSSPPSKRSAKQRLGSAYAAMAADGLVASP